MLLLAVVAPFETPIFRFGSHLTITSVEAAVFLAAGAALTAILARRRPIIWKTPVTRAAAAWLAILLVAALVSPVDRGNALRFAGRMIAAAAVFVIALNAISSAQVARMVVRVLVAVGTLVSMVAILEAAEVRAVLQGLTMFRAGFHVVGGQLRATSTLFYPTIASMYLEVVFALGLWLLLDRRDGSRPARTVIAFVALSIIGAGITATFTRAGLIAMAAALLIVSTLRYVKARRFDSGHLLLAGLAAVLAGLVVLSRSPEALVTRLRTEGSQDWYGATYAGPPTLRFTTGGEYRVPVTLENTGRVIWNSTTDPVFAMSYHWLRAETGEVVQFDGQRTPFRAPVEPHTRVTVSVEVRAPGEPGNYVLVWDVVHEYRAWLSTEGVAPGRTAVTVEGSRVSAAAATMSRLPPANLRADRPILWRAALRIAAAYPITGVGPDNFRQVYGRYAGLSAWDTRVHANNMYLEVLAGAGVAGLLALLWLVGGSGVAVWRQWRACAPAAATPAAAMCAVWFVVAGHGLVDSFLSFTTTYVMFALAAGLAFSPVLSPGTVDADCV